MRRYIQKEDTIAFAWGLAEATFFFIVPDVYITYRALRGVKAAIRAALWTLAGALVGALLMYIWATIGMGALTLVQHVPAIPDRMFNEALAGYENHGVLALFEGIIKGVPYKVFSVLAPDFHANILLFLVVSAVVRLSRFVFSGLVVAGLSHLLRNLISYKLKLVLLSIFWVVFYLFYFLKNMQ